MLLKIASCFLKIGSVSFYCVVFDIINVFTHSYLSVLIFQISFEFLCITYLVIEMQNTLGDVIEESERNIEQATVCFI